MGSEETGEAPQVPRPARSLDATRRAEEGATPPSVRDVVGDARPTRVRDGVPTQAGETEPAREKEAESADLVVEGVAWTVRVRGRGQAGADAGPAPLLMLGFFRDAEGEVPEREALVVARTLNELSARQLEGALDVSRPPPEPGARKELFPETATKGRGGER